MEISSTHDLGFVRCDPLGVRHTHHGRVVQYHRQVNYTLDAIWSSCSFSWTSTVCHLCLRQFLLDYKSLASSNLYSAVLDDSLFVRGENFKFSEVKTLFQTSRTSCRKLGSSWEVSRGYIGIEDSAWVERATPMACPDRGSWQFT